MRPNGARPAGVILPTARTGIITAMILGVARVVGETAPLIMTAFGSATLNVNPFSGPQAALSLSSFQLFGSSQTADVERAWVFAFVLLAIVLILFVAARAPGRAAPRHDHGDRTEALTAMVQTRRSTGRSAWRCERPGHAQRARCPRVVRRPPRAWAGSAWRCRRTSITALDRSIRLREVHVPPDPEPDARARAGAHPSPAPIELNDRRHLWFRRSGHRCPPPHRDGLPEAESVPGDDGRGERPFRSEALRDEDR